MRKVGRSKDCATDSENSVDNLLSALSLLWDCNGNIVCRSPGASGTQPRNQSPLVQRLAVSGCSIGHHHDDLVHRAGVRFACAAST